MALLLVIGAEILKGGQSVVVVIGEIFTKCCKMLFVIMVLALATTLALVLLVPMSLLAIDGTVGGVPTTVVDGLLEAITTPLAALCLYQSFIKTCFSSVKGFTSELALTFYRCHKCSRVLG